MLINAFLRGAIVIRRNHQGPVSAGLFRFAREPNRFFGGIGAGAGDDRNAFVDGFDHRANDFVVLLMAQRGRFAGGAAGHDAMRAVVEMKVD